MAKVIRTRFESSSIAEVSYNPDTGLLEVRYRRTGHTYDYFDVPMDVYRALMEADSKGAFLSQVIKPNYDYARVEFPI